MRQPSSIPVHDERDDRDLVALARSHDIPAFETLYARHKAPLYRTALAITRERGAAEELLQETFLRAYRHLDRIELETGASLRPWLHRIVINLAYDWAARRRRSAAPLESVLDRLATAGSLSPERQAERGEQSRVVDDAVAGLEFRHRIVIILYYLHDMDLSEIAELLNVPEGTVKSRLYYGRIKLRAVLENDVRLARRGGMRYATAQPPVA
jgi:RNA polymerase sigma-70 factor (ECF subfamily)